MRSARKTLLWLSMLGLLLCMGAGQSALAESSIHQLNWNGSTSSAINMDKFSMAASQNLAQSMQVTQVTFSGSKTLLGRDMEAGEFAFLLGDDHGNTLQRLLSNPSPDGVAATFTSNTLYFDKPGTYTFHLWEEVGRLDSVVYDPVSYAIQVTVTQDAQGGLSQTHTIQAGGVVQNAMAFTNTYATTTYSATKKWIYPEGVTPPTGHTHPSVDLQLYRDGEAYSPGGLVEMLPANGTVDGGTTSLTHTWNNLPRYRADGALNADGSRAESVYSFKEVLVPDGYVKMRPADAPDTVENIYWPGVRTLHKLWVGPAPQPTAGGQSLVDVTITQQIYGENGTLITSIPYSIDPPNAFVIAMDGIADTFPNPAPTDPYKLYGEFTPWTYTIGLPSNGTYGGQPVNFDYTFNETKIPGDYMMQGTTTHAAQGVDTITNAYAFTSFIATKQWVGGPEDNRPPVTIRLQHRFINDIGEPTVDDVRDSNGNAIVVVLDGTDDGKPTGEMAPLDKNTWRYRWDKLPRYVRGDLFPDDQREYTYTFIENAVAIERYYKASYSEDGTTVFNTYTPLFNLVAKKHWVKGNAADYHPAPLTLTRQLPGAEAETVLDAYTVVPQEPGAAEYTYTWKGLPETDIAGNPYTYAVRETAEEGRGYVVVAGQVYAVTQTGYDITNTYVPPERVLMNLTARKALAGDAAELVEGAFAFTLTGGGLNLTATNDAAGRVIFPQFALEKAGDYRFTLAETAGGKAGIAYDSARYTALVKVTLNPVQNRLEYSLTWEKDGAAYSQALPVFTNTYTKPAAPAYDPIYVTLTGQKNGMNLKLEAGRFKFVIKDHAGNVLETVTHDAKGLIEFSPLRLGRPGIFLYHIAEVNGGEGILYDQTAYTVRVEVTAQGSTLSSRVTLLKDGIPTAGGISFTNHAIMPPTGDNHLWLPLALLVSSAVLFLAGRRVTKRR